MAEELSISDLPMVAGHPALDFSNTAARPSGEVLNDRLVDYPALLAWSLRAGLLDPAQAEAMRARSLARPEEAARALRRALDLREAIHDVFAAHATGAPVPRRALDRLNRHLAASLAHGRVGETGDAFAWEWGGPPDALDRMLWPLARAAAELLTGEWLPRVRECAAADCGWLFVDTSKNRARRWCSMSDCGNRAKLRRFRARRE